MNLEKKPDWSNEGAIARGKARLARLAELSILASASMAARKPIPSNALAPIESMRGGGYVNPKPKPVPIDWAHWRLMPQVALWEAVALSINANPDDLKFKVAKETNEKFTKRLSIALSHVDAGKLALVEHCPANRPVSRVDLPKFAAWANAQNFGNVPLDLHLIAANAEPEAVPVPLSASVAENEIRLPPGTTHVAFGELAILLTDAQWLDTKPDPTGMGKTLCLIEHENELKAAALDRSLPLKKTSTYGPLDLFTNNSIQSACVTVPDFQAYAKLRFVEVIVESGGQVLQIQETVAQRGFRYLALLEVEEQSGKRGALQHVANREGVDRSKIGKEIKKAREVREEQKRSGAWISTLVKE